MVSLPPCSLAFCLYELDLFLPSSSLEFSCRRVKLFPAGWERETSRLTLLGWNPQQAWRYERITPRLPQPDVFHRTEQYWDARSCLLRDHCVSIHCHLKRLDSALRGKRTACPLPARQFEGGRVSGRHSQARGQNVEAGLECLARM